MTTAQQQSITPASLDAIQSEEAQSQPFELEPSGDALAQIISALNAKTPGSKALAQANRSYLADKSSIGLAFSPSIKQACYPIAAKRADGAYLWDVDGNRYVDILNGLGTNLFGHNPSFIQHALAQQLKDGFPIGPQAPLAGETAALFCQLTNMERLTFSNTGTEAVMTALRIARTQTQRDKVVVFSNSYHGHFDGALMRAPLIEFARRRLLGISENQAALRWLSPLLKYLQFSGSHPAVPGIPQSAAKDIIVLEYNNPRSLDKIKRLGKSLAAVLVEPIQSRCIELKPQAFLQELRAITAKQGTALIFDEMVTGFRLAQGGAQEYFGIEADLATYSKIAGGGLPLSIIAGRNGFMDAIDGGQWRFDDNSSPNAHTTFFAGTFCRHPLSLVAANAVAKRLLEHGPNLQTQLNDKTRVFITRLNDYCQQQDIKVRFTHAGSFFAIDLAATPVSQDSLNALSFLLLIHGVHLRGGDKGGFLSSAHSDQDIDVIYTAFSQSLLSLKQHQLLQ